MNGVKSLFVCATIVLLGNVFSLSQAKAPDNADSTKPSSPPAAKATPEKSVLAETSKPPSKPEATSTDFCGCVGLGESSTTKKIEDVLSSPLHQTGLDYTDQPLQDVVMQLGDEYGIPIQIDHAALEEAGIGSDAPVTINLHNIALRSALNLMLKRLQLNWIIQDEVLMITSRDVANKQFDTCVYNVQGLVDDSDPQSMKSLIEAIEACVASDTWVSHHGSADIMPLRPGLLVVSQTATVQERVSSLLDKIRKVREHVPATANRPPAATPAPTHSSSNQSTSSATPRNLRENPDPENPFGG